MFNENTRNSKSWLIDEQDPYDYYKKPLVHESAELLNVKPRSSGNITKNIDISSELRGYEITKYKGRQDIQFDRMTLTTPQIKSGGEVDKYNLLLAKESTKVCENKCESNNTCDRGNIDENKKYSNRLDDNSNYGNKVQEGFSSKLEEFCCNLPIDSRLEMHDKYISLNQ